MTRESHLRVMPNVWTAQWSSESTGVWSATAIGISAGSMGRCEGGCDASDAEVEARGCALDALAEEGSGTNFGLEYT